MPSNESGGRHTLAGGGLEFQDGEGGGAGADEEVVAVDEDLTW